MGYTFQEEEFLLSFQLTFCYLSICLLGYILLPTAVVSKCRSINRYVLLSLKTFQENARRQVLMQTLLMQLLGPEKEIDKSWELVEI